MQNCKVRLQKLWMPSSTFVTGGVASLEAQITIAENNIENKVVKLRNNRHCASREAKFCWIFS